MKRRPGGRRKRMAVGMDIGSDALLVDWVS